MSIDNVTPQEWDSLRFKTMQERFDINNTYKKEFKEASDKHLDLEEQKASGTLDAHYTKLKIQPMQYSMENNLDPLQHTIIKYVTRFRDKGGERDLQAALKTLNMLIEYEYGNKNAHK